MIAMLGIVKRRSKKIVIVMPFSTITPIQSNREKTLAIGRIARSLVIFRVDELILYSDGLESNIDRRLFSDVLEYMLTPPYLRKKIIPLKNTLKYVGVLPPLRIATIYSVSRIPKLGELRLGIVKSFSNNNSKIHIDVGLSEDLIIEVDHGNSHNINLKKNDIVLVKITSINPLKGVIADKSNVYTGFRFSKTFNLAKTLNMLKNSNYTLIATSRYGVYVKEVEYEIKSLANNSKGIVLIFGSPYEGLNSIFKRLNVSEKLIDITINLVKEQGVKTIRTEEAILIALSVIDYILT